MGDGGEVMGVLYDEELVEEELPFFPLGEELGVKR